MNNTFSNITKRKRQKSTNSLDETFTENNESFNSDNYTSLPDLERESSFDLEQALEYKNIIDQLKTELLSAHQEIENLNKENKDLYDQLNESKKSVQTLKNLLNSENIFTPKFSTVKKRKKEIVNANKSNDIPFLQINDTDIETKNSKTEKLINKPIINNYNKTTFKKIVRHDLQNQNAVNNAKNLQIKSRRKITILGDQQGVGLASVLIKNRMNTNDIINYDISGITYPNATIEHLTKSASLINKENNEDDWVILCLGSNDWNPVKFNIYLSIILNILCKPKIIITSVVKNLYLNEMKLNNLINVTSQNFKNCFYVDLSSYVYKTNYFVYPLYFIGKLVNNCINTQDYRIRYIKNFTKIKLDSPSKQKVNTVIKGTIPYYFSKINNKNKCNTSSTTKLNNIKDKSKIKKIKGTIPYYFNSINKQKYNDIFFREH